MRLILPEELIRQKGVKALGDEKEAIYREIYAPEIHPVEGLRQLLERLTGPASAAPSGRRAAAPTSTSCSKSAGSDNGSRPASRATR